MARQKDNYYLVITESSSVTDSGVYTTEATSAFGASQSFGRLTVNAASESQAITNNNNNNSIVNESSSITKSGQPPEFKKLFYDAFVKLGDVSRLDIVVIGSPKPRVCTKNI
jgi:hypothetical protein